MSIRDEVVAAMKRKKWTAYRLRKETKLSPATVYRFVQGKADVTTEVVEKMMKALDLKVAPKPKK